MTNVPARDSSTPAAARRAPRAKVAETRETTRLRPRSGQGGNSGSKT